MRALIDSHGRTQTYLRVSVTDRCNLHCRYCHPLGSADRSPRAELLTFEEILRVARSAVDLGVTKIRLTGGEPLLRRGLPELVAGLAALPGLATLAMTTNGILLAPLARELKECGLSRVNVSLDTLRPDRFTEIAGHDHLGRVREGIEAALAAGFAPVKLNVVVMRGVNDDELLDFAELCRDRPLDVRFIEHMPIGGAADLLVPWEEARDRIAESLPLEPRVTAESPRAVAREFTVPNFAGRLGFITPVTESFCGGCGRLRLGADGSLRPCLFAPPAASLRPLLRDGATDEELAGALRSAAAAKPETGVPATVGDWPAARCMVEIGG